jgi:hypothetical protein
MLSEKFPEEVKVRQIKRCLLKAIFRDPDSVKSCSSQESFKLLLWHGGVGNGGLG